MIPEDYLRRYTEPFQSLAGSAATGDWQALVLDKGYYYPPHLDLGAALDALNRTELLEILQRLLATEYPQQRPSKAMFQQFIEAFERLKDERAWRQTEMERLGVELADREAWIARQTIELERHQAALARHENDNTILRANLADLRQSTSWKVTAPLRRLSLAVKALCAHAGKLRRF